MISKETIILIAVMIILVVSFMNWSSEKSNEIQNGVDSKIESVLTI